MTNFYIGLHRGPIDHEASSVINSIAGEDGITMGDCVRVDVPLANQLLPRVVEVNSIIDFGYGIAVAGDNDGVYGDGSDGVPADNAATLLENQGIVICTQGRCLARVIGDITAGTQLAPSDDGRLQKAVITQAVLAIALQETGGVGDHIIAVDVQREHIVP